jgi:acetyl esterase/lipase
MIPCNIPSPRRVSFPMFPALKSSVWSCCAALLAASVCIPDSIKAETAALPGIKLWPNGAPGQKGDTAWDVPRVEAYEAPKDKANGGAVLVCPGGGYGGLAADHEGKQVAQFFNSFGVTAFVLSYRLGSHGYHHPIELNDAKRGMRWIRTNAAQYGIDPQRIGVIGFSAGGHLASTLATLFDDGDSSAADVIDRASSRPDWACLCYPVISMIEPFMHRGSRKNLLGPDDNDENGTKMSSERNVTDRTPPTFIFQTDEDSGVPAENAVSFYLALRKHKIPAEMHIYQHGPHGVGLMQGDPILGTWGGHLHDWLRVNGFLSTAKRAAITGTVTINGKPVSWGGVTFSPVNPSDPQVTARVMGGKFKLDAKSGAVLGKNGLKVVYSAADVPTLTASDAPAGVMETTKQSAGGDELSFEVKDGANTVTLELKNP